MTRPARLLDLVHMLAGRRYYTVSEIADRFDVSERTAYRDLAELQERHIPVTRDEYGYKLLETATLRPLNLTAEEHGLLKVALHNPALERHSALRRTLLGLEAKLDAASARAEETPRALQLAGIDRSGPKAGEVMDPLRLAIKKSQPVEIHYASLSGGKTRWRGLDPWQLFQRADAWYLVGRCHLHDEPRIFRLDRISKLRGLDSRFTPPADFDLDRFLEDSWSIYATNGQKQEIVLRFHKSLAPLFLNARHHQGEKVKKMKDGTIDYRVKLSCLDEIARWVIGFGGKAKVLKPIELRDQVVSLAHEIVEAAGPRAGRGRAGA